VIDRLQQFPMTENRTGPQTIEFLTKRVVALGAVQVGQFLVDCETYMSVPQLGKYIFLFCDLASAFHAFRKFRIVLLRYRVIRGV